MGIHESDEPLSPTARMFLRPETHLLINCVVGLERPLEYDVLLPILSDSLMIKHPRFTSLYVTDDKGRDYWRKTEVDISRHIIVRHDPVGEGDDDEEVVNRYIADLAVCSPLSTDKPLWEIHLLHAHKVAVMRFNHALGDGVSILSLMLTLFKKRNDPTQMPTIEPQNPRRLVPSLVNVLKLLKVLWFTMIYATAMVMRVLGVKDKNTVISGGEGVEDWPRKIVTAKFRIEDMKTVKNAVAKATINDVLFGVISLGLSKYLDNASKPIQDGLQLTGMAMVNLRPTPGLQDIKELMKINASTSGYGNKFGAMLLPVYYHRNRADPLKYMKRAKKMIDRKKLSLEAHMSYRIVSLAMKLFGTKFGSSLNYKLISNTTFTVTNLMGPREEIAIAGIPVKFIRPTCSSVSHAITMLMVSYAGRADMQLLVAKDIIPDPEKLAKYFEDALLEMKESAVRDTDIV